MTFLSVYTPTYRRPRMLAQCIASVEAQTNPVQHAIVHDDEGIGIPAVYADIRHHVDSVTGDYVMVLSDDNVLIDPSVAAELEAYTHDAGDPDVVVFKGAIAGGILPSSWACEPQFGRIDLSCFAVKRDVWVEHAEDWGERYEGDFDFIHAVWACEAAHSFSWWDRLAFRALQISGGRPEC